VRATVDRVGLDSHGRPTKVQIRRVKKGDLSRVRDMLEQAFGDFFERQLGTRPRQPFGGLKLSGIGSKAGGPDYLLQFLEPRTISENTLRHGFVAPAELKE